MKKILVFSDTHGLYDKSIEIIEEAGGADAVIHAGDYVRDADKISERFPDIPVYRVKGNCDLYSDAPEDIVCEIGGVKIFITHGHSYAVKSDYRTVAEKARSVGAKVCVFGHTHKPDNFLFGTVQLLNPGSVTFGRTYGVIEIENANAKTSIMEA